MALNDHTLNENMRQHQSGFVKQNTKEKEDEENNAYYQGLYRSL